ncbi:MAG TPA: tyrosine-type recombinase/integrase [Acidimicrobiia bacterium]|nr:tyrosine-type recombinase/integrase [Acidimicrobiia bacterium]
MSRREGGLFRRCHTCGQRVPSPLKTCGYVDQAGSVCGGEVGWGFVFDVALPGAKRRKRVTRSGFSTKKQAVAAMREVQEADAKGSLVEPTRLTVGEYLAEWLAATRSRVGDDLSATGWRDYEIHVRRHITRRIEEVPLQALDRNHVKALYAWVQEGNSSRGGRRPSPKTVHNIHLTLHRALEDAVADGLIARNPATRARKAPKAGREMLTWDEDQLRSFFHASAEDRLFPLWQMTAMSGMRRGEILGLRWDDVDFKSSTVTVNRQWRRGEKGLVLAPPKTERSRRTIDLDTETVTVLKKWRTAQLEEQMAYDGEWQDNGFIFTRKDGRRHDVDVVSQHFDRLVARAGVPPVRFHDMRHTHATLLLLAGVPAHVVSMRLGHRSVAFTLQQYAHVLPQQQADAIKLLAIRLFGET